jgi:hypothetical protein
MNELSACEESFEIVDSFALALMAKCDATDVDFETYYCPGEIMGKEDALTLSIAIFTETAAVFLIEDRYGTLWLSYKPRDGRCSAVEIALATDIDLMLDRCIDVLAR